MTLEQELTQIERTLWTNDASLYEARFLPDAIVIFPEVGRMDRDAAVAAIRDENAAGRHWADVDFAAIRLLVLAPQVALLSYESTARWNYEEIAARTFCLTVYVKEDSGWRVALHQQTTG
jgi:hypothetical protein